MNLADDDTHLSKIQVLKAFDLPALTDYITLKRMRWVGHALRRNDKQIQKSGPDYSWHRQLSVDKVSARRLLKTQNVHE